MTASIIRAMTDDAKYVFDDDGNPNELMPFGSDAITVPPARNPAAVPQWDKRLVMDVCLGTSEDAILETYDLTAVQFGLVMKDPVFTTAVQRMREELKDDGATFKLKCRLQAEAMLEENWRLAHSPGTDPRVKERIIANTVRWAGWDNPGGAGQGGGSGFQVVINLGVDQEKGVTYDHDEN